MGRAGRKTRIQNIATVNVSCLSDSGLTEEEIEGKKINELGLLFARALMPPPELTVDEYADTYRVLPQGSSSEHGRWRTSRFPFLREIMFELSPQSKTQEIVVMKGAQLGFTELAMNLMLYCVEYRPTPVLYLQKTVDAVERFSKQRLTPSIQAMPGASSKILDDKSSSDTIRMKTFPGGVLILGGANSSISLRSMPIEICILDELDSFASDIEEEGDPSEIAIRRTSNFPRRKIYKISTPAIKETSMIEPAYEAGDQRKFYVPCPFCKGMQTIEWHNIKYKNEHKEIDLKNIYLECIHCHAHIQEKYKTQMLAGGKWIKENPESDIASFFISSLYSPVGFYSWKDAAKLFIKAQKNFSKEQLKVFINTVLGETFSESNKSIHADTLERRKEVYTYEVPHDVLCLTAGVDVQGDRLEMEVLGHGKNMETWSIDYIVLRGDPEQSQVWNDLDKQLSRVWKHENGSDMNISCTAVDSGNMARIVYNFCRTREHQRIFPIKGDDGFGKGYMKRPITKLKEGHVWLFIGYVDEIKSKIYSQLKLEESGAGYCHFPDNKQVYDEMYFKQLTAERLVTVKNRSTGKNKLVWKLASGRRNEALDCRVYATLALMIIQPYFDLMAANDKPATLPSQTKKRNRILSKGA